MKLNYYPGCTMKNHAKNFEDSAIGALKKLDIEVVEIPRWNCRGTVYSLATDDLMHHVAPIRNLLRVKEMEDTSDDVMTLCSMCYNTLKRSNERVKREPESLKVINELMYKEAKLNFKEWREGGRKPPNLAAIKPPRGAQPEPAKTAKPAKKKKRASNGRVRSS